MNNNKLVRAESVVIDNKASMKKKKTVIILQSVLIQNKTFGLAISNHLVLNNK